MNNLIVIVTFNDYTCSVTRRASIEEANSYIETVKQDSSVVSIELVNATTYSYWDNPSPSLECWIDETEL